MKKANRILGMKNEASLIDRKKHSLYKTVFRPHLEYCSQKSPHYDKDIKLIESVQRKATKLVTGMQGHEKIHRLVIGKYALIIAVCNRVIDNWNLLSTGCINCNVIRP